jgi:dGTPase
MRLTYATLGSMVKYPCLAEHGLPNSIFGTEAELFRETCTILGIPEIQTGVWQRHPLSYLMEAADDICYSILDIEDAIELGIVSFNDVKDIIDLLCNNELDVEAKFKDNQNNFRDFLSSIRGLAIQNLIETIADVFVQNYEAIMNGTLQKPLLELTKAEPALGIARAKKIARERIYPDRRKTELEVGAYTTLSILLDAFITGIYEYQKRNTRTYRADRIVRLIGKSKVESCSTLVEAYHQALDFISGMTDNYAGYLAKQIGGLAGKFTY